MVLIHLKISDKNQFLYEASHTMKIDEVLKDLVLVNNLRCKIDLIAVQIEELMKHGPLRPEELRGLNESLDIDKHIEDKYKPKKTPMPEQIGNNFVEDPNHHRTGWTFDKLTVEKSLNEIIEIKKLISCEMVNQKKAIKIQQLNECIDYLRAIVYIHYPAYFGLPEWEPCRVLLESKEDILNKEDPRGEFYNYSVTTLWCAGKEYERHKLLSDYVGKNDKTKIICKFSSKGSGAPVREPVVDSETQKRMMQIYFKKQEEMKKLETNSEDDYLNSQWADSQGLKKSMYTGSNISWKFK
jgi:hypothetical protein